MTTKADLVKRLRGCVEALMAGDEFDGDDGDWLASILEMVLNGDDIRWVFYDKATRGRSPSPDNPAYWIAVDALFMTQKTGIKGRALWASLGKKWCKSSGTIKNAIAKNRSVAQIFIDHYGEEGMRILDANFPEHKKPRI